MVWFYFFFREPINRRYAHKAQFEFNVYSPMFPLYPPTSSLYWVEASPTENLEYLAYPLFPSKSVRSTLNSCSPFDVNSLILRLPENGLKILNYINNVFVSPETKS